MAQHCRLILASASETRAALLRNAGIVFETAAARIDEEAVRQALIAEGAGLRDIAGTLAEMKALKASSHDPDALCLGADQILSMADRIFAKPGSPADARDQLRGLCGATHRLHSAAVVAQAGRPVWRHVEEARITLHALSDAEIASYVTRNWDRIRHSVGCYLIEETGIRLIAGMEGDYFAILGLPLLPLLTWLRLRGDIAES